MDYGRSLYTAEYMLKYYGGESYINSTDALSQVKISKGCAFSTRCSRCMGQCRIEKPVLKK